MRNHAIAMVLGLSLAALPSPSEAQVTVSPYAGAMIYDGSLMIWDHGNFQGSGIEDDGLIPVVGLRVGYALFPGWSAEISYGRSWLENRSGDLASHLVHGMLQYRFLQTQRWSAHLGAGGGGIGYRSADPALNALWDATIGGGLGAAYRITPRVEIRTDLRFFGQFCRQANDRDGLACNDGSQLGYSELSAGVRIRL